MREITDGRVLDLVFTAGPISRAEIAERTGISKPTVSESIRRLESTRLVVASGSQGGRPGRVATLYTIAADRGFVLAVELDPGGIRICGSDIFGRVFEHDYFPADVPRSAVSARGRLRDVVASAIATAQPHRGPLLALGVSVANPVDPVTNAVITLFDAPRLESHLQPAEVLADIVEAPILIDNDVNLAAVAERWTGIAGEAESFAYVFVGTGVGMGLMMGDRLIRGARGAAGEIGFLGFSQHPGLVPEERQQLARTVASGQLHGQLWGESIDTILADAHRVLELAAQGDTQAQGIVDREARLIGEAIAAICAVVDPELIVLGGPIGSNPILLEPVRQIVRQLAPVCPRVELSALADTAPLRGALAWALNHARTELWTSAIGIGPSQPMTEFVIQGL